MVGNLKLVNVISKENTEKHDSSFFNLDIKIGMKGFRLVPTINATNFCFLLFECPTTQLMCHLP